MSLSLVNKTDKKHFDNAKRCSRCLLPEGLDIIGEIFVLNTSKQNLNDDAYTTVRLDANQVCQLCTEYEAKFSKKRIEKELNTFINMPSSSKDYDAIVCYSGGKDSTIALYHAVKKYKLKVLAYMLDNGFIPQAVKERAQKICDGLGVELLIVSDDIYQEFLKEYYYDDKKKEWETNSGKDMCMACSKKISLHLKETIAKFNVNKVIYGINTAMKNEPRISSLSRRDCDQKTNHHYWSIALPFAERITYEEQQNILKEMNWEEIRLKGYTSNCLIPGFTEGFAQKKCGVNFDLPYLARELRSGYLDAGTFKELISDKENKTIDHQMMTDFFEIKGLISQNDYTIQI